MPTLNKGSRTEFPKGGLYAEGRMKAGLTISNGGVADATLGVAFERAGHEFRREFGRWPDWEKILFRGSFVTGGAVVEICEPQD